MLCVAGQIVAGQGSPASPAGGSQMSSAAVCSDLDAAQRDPAVKAVVFRVDSPGGSHTLQSITLLSIFWTTKATHPGAL